MCWDLVLSFIIGTIIVLAPLPGLEDEFTIAFIEYWLSLIIKACKGYRHVQALIIAKNIIIGKVVDQGCRHYVNVFFLNPDIKLQICIHQYCKVGNNCEDRTK